MRGAQVADLVNLREKDMTQKFHDDATGLVIQDGYSFRIGIMMGDNEPSEYRDYVEFDDLVAALRLACFDADGTRKSCPPLQILVQTWAHCSPMSPSWQR